MPLTDARFTTRFAVPLFEMVMDRDTGVPTVTVPKERGLGLREIEGVDTEIPVPDRVTDSAGLFGSLLVNEILPDEAPIAAGENETVTGLEPPAGTEKELAPDIEKPVPETACETVRLALPVFEMATDCVAVALTVTDPKERVCWFRLALGSGVVCCGEEPEFEPEFDVWLNPALPPIAHPAPQIDKDSTLSHNPSVRISPQTVLFLSCRLRLRLGLWRRRLVRGPEKVQEV